MEQEEENVPNAEENVKPECHESSNDSMLLNLYCDSNPDLSSEEASLQNLNGKNVDKNPTGKVLDFSNVEELLAAETKAYDRENCKTRNRFRLSDGKQIQIKPGEGVHEEQKGSSNIGNVSADDETMYKNVEIRTIVLPEDDDLFDFQKDNTDDGKWLNPSGELEKTELYKYLTESDIAQLRSLEVTPSQSRHESGESEQSDASDGYMSEGSEEVTRNKQDQNLTLDSGYLPGGETPSKEPVTVEGKKSRRKAAMTKTKKNQAKHLGLTEKTLDKLQKSKEVTAKWIQDLAIPDNLSFSQKVSLDILDLNQYLTCGLCKGYLYEASTVTECMHTFCKNCIVLHCMNVSLHCPVCSILIHPTDPFVNIRLDRMIQDIVYKLLPTVAETEMERIKTFYTEHPEVEPKEIHEPPSKPKVSPRDKEARSHSQHVSLLLETEEDGLQGDGLEKKFIRVTSRATVNNVCTFLKKKLNLTEKSQVELFCCGDAVEDGSSTLEIIKNKFYGDQDSLMLMQYKIRDS